MVRGAICPASGKNLGRISSDYAAWRRLYRIFSRFTSELSLLFFFVFCVLPITHSVDHFCSRIPLFKIEKRIRSPRFSFSVTCFSGYETLFAWKFPTADDTFLAGTVTFWGGTVQTALKSEPWVKSCRENCKCATPALIVFYLLHSLVYFSCSTASL